MNFPSIAVVGGTGNLGAAIAWRLARAGYPVVIGSRSADGAQAAQDAPEVDLVGSSLSTPILGQPVHAVPSGPGVGSRILSVLKMPIVLALFTFVLFLTVLGVTKVGFCGVDVESEDEEDKKRTVNWKATLITASIAAAIVLVVPYILQWRSNSAAAAPPQPVAFVPYPQGLPIPQPTAA